MATLVSLFDLTPEGFPFNPQRDVLIFDLLLSTGGVQDPAGLYPPTNAASLETLLEAISESRYDTLEKGFSRREESFAKTHCIPPQFRALSDAYWHLDSGIQIGRAVALLADRRLNRDHTSKIIHILGLTEDPSRFIVRYVQSAKPVLDVPAEIDTYALALAEYEGLRTAWHYQRTYSESDPSRRRVWTKLLQWTTSPKPKPAALEALMSLPLNSLEHDILQALAVDSSQSVRSRSIYQDAICVRLIQTGQYSLAIKLDRTFSAATSESSKVEQMRERERMCKEVYRALPESERMLIDNGWQVLPPKASTSQILSTSTSSVPPLKHAWVDLSNSMRDSRNTLQNSMIGASTSAHRPLPSHSVPPIPLSTPAKPVNKSMSANRQPNAFYQPPPLTAPKQAPPLANGNINALSSNGLSLLDKQFPMSLAELETPTVPPSDISMEDDDIITTIAPNTSSPYPLAPALPNGFVDNLTTPSPMPHREVSLPDLSASVPGAFAEEDAPQKPEPGPSVQPSSPPSKGTRRLTRKSSFTHEPPDAPPSKRQRIPGALDESDHDAEAAEEEDEVASLPSPTMPTTKARGGRKARASSEEADLPRRRSSRLSSTQPQALPIKSNKGANSRKGGKGRNKKS
ncbi:nuclear pore complex assembly-domain-containing protein [Flagelloscypha sp. PMI_526]|nr:nuclear pore complex assembly-domain-containing protein [Flagelloscypha sp. PMI_526]